MSDIFTTLGRIVSHFHLGSPELPGPDFTAAEKKRLNKLVVKEVHGVAIAAQPTRKFNCHGLAYVAAHAWFNSPKKFQEDDYTLVEFADVRVGDIVSYFSDQVLMHSAIVVEVSGGQIKLRSKWGSRATVIHGLTQVPDIYGHATRPRRRNPA